jgi:TolB-like protein/DNA-binding winged helix-turn-helix (wHTH) protein/Flp pilus assembly protein TadD
MTTASGYGSGYSASRAVPASPYPFPCAVLSNAPVRIYRGKLTLFRYLYEGNEFNWLGANMTALPAAKNGSNYTRNDSSGQPGNGAAGFRIADWTVEPALTRLTRNGNTVRLEPKVMAVLVYLAERPGQAVSREELEEAVWAGTIVSYDALTGAIQKLRKAFNDDSRRPRIIETLSKRGYRLVAPVEPLYTQKPQQPSGDVSSGSLPRYRMQTVWLVIFAALLITAGALTWHTATYQSGYEAVSDAAINSIAVLPFDNLSGLPDQEYFSDGMTDELITGLAKHPDLLVIARDSAFMYKDKATDIRVIAAQLNVQYILHGSVRRENEKVRINAQLVDTSNNMLLWAESYDGTKTRIFELQDSITGKIVLALTEKIGNTGTKGEYREISNAQAYDSFLLGKKHFYLYHNKEENRKAREFFQASVKYDPDFAMAYAMLAWTHVFDAINSWSDNHDQSLLRARELATKAISLEKELPVAYWVKGLSYREMGEYVKAMVEAEQAIKYDPNYANAHVLLATLLYYAGRPEEGLERIQKAMLINPYHPFNYTFHLGQAYFMLERYAEAIDAFMQAIDSNPASERIHVWLAAAYAQSGAIDDAKWEADQVLTLNPDFSLQRMEKSLPFKDKEDLGRFIDGLRIAGLS